MKIGLVLFILLGGLWSCQDQSQKFVIGVSQCNSDEWGRQLSDELEREVNLYEHIELDLRIANHSSEKQVADIKQLIERNVDVLIVSPNESKPVTPIVEKAYKAGIPVIVMDRKTESNLYTAFISSDNYDIGELAGHYAESLTKRPLKVFEIGGQMGATTSRERHQGFVDVIEKNPHLTFLGRKDAYWDAHLSEKIMDSVFREIPDLDLVFAQNDNMAIGVSRAARKLHRKRPVYIIGVDGLTSPGLGVDEVMKGNLTATCLNPTGGDKVIQLAVDILNGRKFQRETVLPSVVVDQRNARIMMLQSEQMALHDEKIEQVLSTMNSFLGRYNLQRLLLWAGLIIVVLLIAILAFILQNYWQKANSNKVLQQHIREISKQRDLLQEQKNQLIELSHQVEKATYAKLQFFTNVSHDLRTPLSLIADPFNRLIEDGAQTEKQKQLFPIIRKNVQILTTLVNQVLDFQKFESGKMQLNCSEFDLVAQLEAWNHAFSELALQKHIKLSLNVESGTSLKVVMDLQKIERVYFNLVSNAMKYTRENGEVTTRVALVTKENEPFVELSVLDTGMGIESKQIQAIFENFYQADTHYGGSGIGLALVKSFVDLHHGNITVESEVGKGSLFTILLPQFQGLGENVTLCSGIAPNETTLEGSTEKVPDEAETYLEKEPTQNNEIYDEPNLEDLQNKILPTLLVVDDNPDICEYIVSLLSEDYQLVCAPDGKRGLALASRIIPDLIISDIMMPVMDGLELTRQLKNEMRTCHIPVILLSACALDEKRIAGFDEGADCFLSKPFNAMLLRARIQNLLKNRNRMNDFYKSKNFVQLEDISATDKSFIERFRELLESRLSDPELSVDALGSEMGLSRAQLYRKVKVLTNYSPVELLRMARLKKARNLMAATHKNISEIAYEVGFSSPSYFTKCYRDEFGEAPNEQLKKRT